MMRRIFRNGSMFLLLNSCLLLGESIPVEPVIVPMPNLHKYMLRDFHLAKQAKYFDIKWYSYDKQHKRYKYGGGWAFDMPAYKKLSSKEKKKIRSSFPSARQRGFAVTYKRGREPTHYFVHYIDRLSRVHILDSYDKLVHFLGEIDTPAEHYVIALISTEGR